MQIKNLHIIILFLIVTLCSKAQGIDDVFEKEKPNTQNEGVTLIVDTDIPQGRSGESEKAKQDSMQQFNAKWESYWMEKNMEIEQLFNIVEGIESDKITKETIKDYMVQVDNLKNEVDFKISNDLLWKDNAQLDKMRTSFFATHNRTLTKLQQWDEKVNHAKDPTKKLITLGICFLAIMAFIPIFNQIKAIVMVQRAKQQQREQAKKMREDAEKQMLLADDNNVVTLKD